VHYYPDRGFHSDSLKSPFLNEKTFALMDYFRLKHEKKEVGLIDGMDLIAEFMINFGVKFEPIDQRRYYCRVLDI
jgi:hypothetical protein